MNSMRIRKQEVATMAARFIWVALFLFLGIPAFSFGARTDSVAQPFMVAAQQNASVEIYVTSWCPYCKQAIKFLKAHNVKYVVYDIEKDSAAAERKERLSGQMGVPFAVINGKGIYGFSREAYSEALGIKQ